MATPVEWLGNYQVNTGMAAGGTQLAPQTIGLSNGNYLVVWAEDGEAVGTVPGRDFIGKIFDAEGNVVRDSFQLNNFGPQSGLTGDVAATDDGGFVATYTTYDEDTDVYTVLWERYDATGNQVDSDAVETAGGDDVLQDAKIVFDPTTGTSILTFNYFEGGAFTDDKIQMSTVSSAGVSGPVVDVGDSDEILFNEDLAILSNGNLVAVFAEPDNDVFNPEAVIFDPAGNVIANVGISADEMSFRDMLRVASLANGDWVVVWHASDLNNGDIRFRIYGADGAPRTGVRTYAGGDATQTTPDVIALPDGDFILCHDNNTTDQLRAQRFNSDGTTDSATFIVADDIVANPDVGVTADGRILFAWDHESTNTITSSIWDPRNGVVFGFDYVNTPRNFLETTVLTSGPDDTTVFGSGLNNLILCQGGDDLVFGAEGAETILGRGGADNIAGGDNADSIEGNAGDDTVQGGQGSDVLNGGADRDTVSYANSNAAVNVTINGDINSNFGGHADGDALFGFETLVGSSFNDTLRAASIPQGGSAYTAYGGDGDDSIVGSGSAQTGGGADALYGDRGRDTIFGGVGADFIDGGADGDSLNGGAGNDTVYGGAGGDSIFGGASGFGAFGAGGSDRLFGDAGADTIGGGVGNDTLNGGIGGDALDGGTGTDWADHTNALGKLRADLQVSANNTGDAAGDSYLSIENLRGSLNNDTLRGDDAANFIDGYIGNDDIAGRAGNDTLDGFAGRDTMEGGDGADRFVLDRVPDKGQADTILDFGVGGNDEIALLGSLFGLTPGALGGNRFVLGTAAADANDRVIYNQATGKLWFDADGDGAQAQVLIATLTNTPVLAASDFVVI